jgi:hypothetical protein
MGLYKCTGCGKVIDTIPRCCSEDMIFNQETNRFECNMGPNCGYLPLDALKCEECCKIHNS